MATKELGRWVVCPHCGGKYHVGAMGKVDVYCPCIARTQSSLRHNLAKLRYKLEHKPTAKE